MDRRAAKVQNFAILLPYTSSSTNRMGVPTARNTPSRMRISHVMTCLHNSTVNEKNVFIFVSVSTNEDNTYSKRKATSVSKRHSGEAASERWTHNSFLTITTAKLIVELSLDVPQFLSRQQTIQTIQFNTLLLTTTNPHTASHSHTHVSCQAGLYTTRAEVHTAMQCALQHHRWPHVSPLTMPNLVVLG